MTSPRTSLTSRHTAVYDALQQVRETFHREGRIGDSNAKLDETVKFLAIHYGYLRGLVEEDVYCVLQNRHTFNVTDLNDAFQAVANDTVFHRKGMGSIFGSTPSTIFEPGDENIAYDLFRAAERAIAVQSSDDNDLDILNEAFGHFVRDTFRNHIEDAQYMTPSEVVKFMAMQALELIVQKSDRPPKEFLLVDPSCGVGSFLTAWRNIYTATYGASVGQGLKCIGQDKVDRMVRLSAINLIFSDSQSDDVFLGNTIQDGSPLSEYDGQVDLILTNPPFGARFGMKELLHTSPRSTPFVTKVLSGTKAVNSELLFLDRYMTLLRPGGVCLSIVPDGVISAKGVAAILRQHLARSAELISVVELPAVTFAQAGTRTKTSVLSFRKKEPSHNTYPIFFAEVQDLGFQVSRRKSVPIKKYRGVNQLPEVLDHFRLEQPSSFGINCSTRAGWRKLNPGAQESWTPRTMLFDRDSLEKQTSFSLVPLKDLTELPRKRKAIGHDDGTYFISVLHVIGEGILDMPGIKSYRPVSPGLPVEPGEVIFSRINPRIPRVAVVPDLGRKLLCSPEYEILRPKVGISSYLVAFLLLTPFVQNQIQALTAGTSASHSRIKPRKIYELLIPAQLITGRGRVANELSKYEEACKTIVASLIDIEQARHTLDV